MWKSLTIRNRSAKCNSQEVVRKKGKIEHRKMVSIEVMAEKLSRRLLKDLREGLEKYLKPAFTLFLQLEQIYQLSQIKQNLRQPESFLIPVKEDITCKYFKMYHIQL